MTHSLDDIAPTYFRLKVRAQLPIMPNETLTYHCKWLDDALETALSNGIALDRVIAVEFQMLHNQQWKPISAQDLAEAIARITPAAGVPA